jgi:hypothetical protein
MSRSRKLWLGFLLLLALLAVVLLSSSISNTTYVVGSELGFGFTQAGAVDQPVLQEEMVPLAPWQRALVIAALIFATIATFTSNRRQFFVTLGVAGIIILLAVFLGDRVPPLEPLEEMDRVPNETADSGIDIIGPQEAVPVTVQPPPPEAGVALASYVLIALVVAAVGGVAALGIYSYRHRPNARPLRQIARQAEIAIADIEAGGDVRDAIMQCYLQMSQTAAGKRGVRRADSMTPREFEESLINAGLPPRSVERLTRLFEEVRYGGTTPGKRQELEAVSALREIVDFINRARQSAETEPAGAMQ